MRSIIFVVAACVGALCFADSVTVIMEDRITKLDVDQAPTSLVAFANSLGRHSDGRLEWYRASRETDQENELSACREAVGEMPVSHLNPADWVGDDHVNHRKKLIELMDSLQATGRVTEYGRIDTLRLKTDGFVDRRLRDGDTIRIRTDELREIFVWNVRDGFVAKPHAPNKFPYRYAGSTLTDRVIRGDYTYAISPAGAVQLLGIATHNQSNQKDNNGKDFVELKKVPYRWTHGATDLTLGDGLLVYSIIHYMRAKNCVCLGSGGGFIPRIMTQARVDLYDSQIFEGNRDYNWGDIGVTYLVDASNGVGGNTDWVDEKSFLRENFHPRVILDTTENAYYNFFVKEDIKIDYLHIDAGHSYEDVKKDFELYTKLLSPNGIVSIHDTDESFEKEYIVTDDIKTNDHQEITNGPSKLVKELKENKEWEIFNFFNNGIFKTKPASTGLTILQRCKN